jgi:general secretion pathway protein F
MSTEEVNVTTHPLAILAKGKLSSEDLVTLNEEIAGMARAGLPLDQGLAALAREMNRSRLQRVTAQLATDLQSGHTLPEALARQSHRLPPYYSALVTAGIRSGRVGDVLATLTSHARAMAELRSDVLGALLYPFIVMVLSLGVVTSLAYFVVPLFEQIFRDFRMVLPHITQWALLIGHHPVLFIALPPVLLCVVLLVLRFVLISTPQGRRLWARWVYSIPLAGTLIRSSRLAAYTDLLAILVEHEVPLPEAFQLAGAAASDPLMVSTSRFVEEDLRRGLPLAEALRLRKSMPEVVIWMAGMGERRGNLPSMLRQVAELYRRQAELRASLLRSVLPPMVIIITGAFVTTLFMSVLLPLFSLLKGLGGF